VSLKLLVLSGEFQEGNSTNIRSDEEVLSRDNSWCGDSSDSDIEDDVPLKDVDEEARIFHVCSCQKQTWPHAIVLDQVLKKK
jgi:hypothetical protein